MFWHHQNGNVENVFNGASHLPGRGHNTHAPASAVPFRHPESAVGAPYDDASRSRRISRAPPSRARTAARRPAGGRVGDSAFGRARSLVVPGTPDGNFRILFQFEDEQLSELRNATVHAFASLSIRQVPGGGTWPTWGSLCGPCIASRDCTCKRSRPFAGWSSIRPSFAKCRVRGPNAMAARAVSRLG